MVNRPRTSPRRATTRCHTDRGAQRDRHRGATNPRNALPYGTQGDQLGTTSRHPLSVAQQRVELIGNVLIIERSRVRVVPQRC
jgi:hypothetical protein